MVSNGDQLPNPSKVVRYVGFAKMFRDEDDNVLGPAATAFKIRNGEKYLSVTWCEYFEGEGAEQLRCAIEAIRSSSIDVKPKACFCVASTEDINSCAASFGRVTYEVYLPQDDNVAHAGVFEISPEEAQLLERLADEVWAEFLTKDMADALPLSECRKNPNVT